MDFSKDRDDVPIPDELQAKFAEDAAFKAAWDELTPGRKRG